MEHAGTVRTGSAWLTAAAATPVSYKLCTASFARTINIYELQVEPCPFPHWLDLHATCALMQHGLQHSHCMAVMGQTFKGSLVHALQEQSCLLCLYGYARIRFFNTWLQCHMASLGNASLRPVTQCAWCCPVCILACREWRYAAAFQNWYILPFAWTAGAVLPQQQRRCWLLGTTEAVSHCSTSRRMHLSQNEVRTGQLASVQQCPWSCLQQIHGQCCCFNSTVRKHTPTAAALYIG